ncbi:sorting nexin-29 isoform X2 [Carcharodon carcharias]|uniref:sorting nexin-29 isoform X2 n=1 Tax=Carcharodon carcharias TaxID=13397 RepID=UPI001B7EE603|nr:sorting nexin-29 isoform X2 [Carcharodon carcharias]
MSVSQQNDGRRQSLLERLLDAVKQCQIRFGGRKEIASDTDSRVICLCAQFETVLQHGLRRSRGLALTAAAIKQAAGFANKTETEPVFWYYVKEHLNKHELQRYYSLKNITTDIGRGRAWLRSALNEHSLERYMHMLLGDGNLLSVFYEDWSFMREEERASMLPTMAAGLNSILFAINIDNEDLNGPNKPVSAVANLLKESTQNVTSLLKESTQGVSTLLKEITTVSAVPSFMRPEPESDRLPVLSKTVNHDGKNKREKKKKKMVPNIISFDGDNEEEEQGSTEQVKSSDLTSSEENSERSSAVCSAIDSSMILASFSPDLNGKPDSDGKEFNSSILKTVDVCLNGDSNHKKLDMKSIDDDDDDEDDDEDVDGEHIYQKISQSKEIEEDRLVSEQSLVQNLSISQMSSWNTLQVLNDNDSSDILFPFIAAGSYSQSGVMLRKHEAAANIYATSENLVYCDEHENVPLAVELAQKGSQQHYSAEAATPLQADIVGGLLPVSAVPESMTVDELRQAIVAMMNRKDELEEQNRSLRNLLDGEMEHSAALRQEFDNQKKKLAEQEERHAAKVQALARENEVLKVQLKKYVGAVQMLKREGGQVNDVLPNLRSGDTDIMIPEPKPVVDNDELANTYERKLIEVAEMHGELIEFNERLHRSLMAKEALISQMRQELIDLRGPVPGDLSQTSEDQSLSDFEMAHCALINVWIPTVFLRGRAANAFHVYQVYIRIKDDEWNVYRRYTEFRALHTRLRAKFPSVNTFHFPPKKAIGNKDAKFVEERRKQLQEYLRSIMNKIIQTLPEFTSSPKKETLMRLLPFCVDVQPTGEPASKAQSKAISKFSRLSRTHHRETRNPEPQSGDL